MSLFSFYFFYLFAGEWHANNTKQCSFIMGDHPKMRHSEQENKAVYNFRRNISGRRILSERKLYSFYIKVPSFAYLTHGGVFSGV